ncbi:MAG: hypothetical protein ABR555_10610 [Pyrinomonadaceae bacterium]
MTKRKSIADDRRRRKMITAIWMLAVSVGVILLIYWELTAILYILATLSVTALLIVVAMSDLAHQNITGQLSPVDEAAASASEASSNLKSTTVR